MNQPTEGERATNPASMGAEPVYIPRDPVAERLAEQLRRLPAVDSVQIRAESGDLLAASPDEGPDTDAAWTAFVLRRAQTLSDGDARGFGERIGSGRLERLVLSGPQGETLALRHGERFVWLTLAPPALAESVEPLARQALRQYRPG